MDQELERRWRLVLLWQRGFLLVVLAIGVVGCVIAARSGNDLPAGQLAAVAAIAVGGLIWNNGRHRRRKALEEGVARRFSRDTPKSTRLDGAMREWDRYGAELADAEHRDRIRARWEQDR